MFDGTGYRLKWQDDMESYLKMHGYPAEKLKVWRKLRSQMPPWEELHKKYGN